MTQNVVKTKVKKCEKQNHFYTSITVHQSNLRRYDKSQNNHQHGVHVVMDTTCKYRQFLKVVLCLNEYLWHSKLYISLMVVCPSHFHLLPFVLEDAVQLTAIWYRVCECFCSNSALVLTIKVL